LPPVEELDGVLGTERWRIKKSETSDPFEELDRKLEGMVMKGRKGVQASHLPGGKGQEGTARMILAGGARGAKGLDF
ncbi:hypothetical protein LTS18_014507, partial [Coniosporium uncinatum]